MMNPASIRRFILTLMTGYLAIFGVRQLPYEFDNEWFVLIPVLLVVYVLTTWIDGQIFGDNETQLSMPKKKILSKNKSEKKGFGDA
ncbi:MAG: hypothetical protein ACJ0GX_08620 [Parasynechococcus sp.]|mgnify:CR=1 FL=1|jgi:hypothetical protein|uniref:hypothetical protein n=1 Tax=Parasynechococcus sp. TaxID=3101203 RepID=UPI000E14DE76|nr:hypothetical protein [Synechococcus sp. AH-601-J22]MDB4623325.1 hypothetical protein [bacterium]RCL56080.1 MAG: hypothetical protein DBW83_09250 [Synechococcus sp. MED-G69]|tara:strand:+ start:4881 stop:5138 length:258 start_codon:yes stop_codon:yes gene_type:complete